MANVRYSALNLDASRLLARSPSTEYAFYDVRLYISTYTNYYCVEPFEAESDFLLSLLVCVCSHSVVFKVHVRFASRLLARSPSTE